MNLSGRSPKNINRKSSSEVQGSIALRLFKKFVKQQGHPGVGQSQAQRYGATYTHSPGYGTWIFPPDQAQIDPYGGLYGQHQYQGGPQCIDCTEYQPGEAGHLDTFQQILPGCEEKTIDGGCSNVPSRNKSFPYLADHIRGASISHAPAKKDPCQVHGRIATHRCPPSVGAPAPPCASDFTATDQGSFAYPSGQPQGGGLPGLEDGVSLGRHSAGNGHDLHCHRQKHNPGLGRENQDINKRPSSSCPSPVCGSSSSGGRVGSSGVPVGNPTHQTPSSTRQAHEHHHRRGVGYVVPSRSKTHRSLNKAGSNHAPGGSRSPLKPRFPFGKTRATVFVQPDDVGLHCLGSKTRIGPQDAGGHKTPIEATGQREGPFKASNFLKRFPTIGEFFRHTRKSESSHLPVHCPEVDELSIDEIVRRSKDTPYHQRMVYLSGCLKPEPYNSLPNTSDNPDSSLSIDELAALIKSGHFGRIPRRAVRRMCKAFLIDEVAKGRRRIIIWPEFLNSSMERMPFASIIGDVADKWATPAGSFSRCFDAKCGFFQIPLPAETQRHYAFRVGKQYFTVRKLPMGVWFAPELFHTIMAVLTHELGESVRTFIHIDNVRINGDSEEIVNKAVDEFLKRCKDCGVTMREEPADIFLGAVLDHVAGAASCTTESILKLQRSAKSVLDQKNCCLGELREFVSRLCWASRILRIPLANFYGALKFIRRRFVDDKNDAIISVWESAKPVFREWLSVIEANKPAFHPGYTDQVEFTMFTDASLSGFGAVLVSDKGDVQTFSGRWADLAVSGDINYLEMRALTLAARHWPHLSKSRSLQIVMDNSSCLSTLKKGSAYSFNLNKALREALGALPSAVPITIAYISSSLNPADALSRGFRFAAASLQPACGLLGKGGFARVRVAGCTPKQTTRT